MILELLRPFLVRINKWMANLLPVAVVVWIFKWCTRGYCVSVCLHRISTSQPKSEFFVKDSTLDSFLEMVSQGTGQGGARKTFITFDDGYEDAVSYIGQRAGRYKNLDWLLFVCPDKLIRRQGFVWDLVESQPRASADEKLSDVCAFDRMYLMDTYTDHLSDLADHPDYALATIADCQLLLEQDNVGLGNHTNHHQALGLISEAEVGDEIDQSFSDFEMLFSKARHFAYPFGTPGYHYTSAVTQRINQTQDVIMWSTYSGPFKLEDLTPGTVLPRFLFYGNRTAKEMVLAIAGRSLGVRLWGGSVLRVLN